VVSRESIFGKMSILSHEHATIFVRWVVSFDSDDNFFRSAVTAIMAIILSWLLNRRRRRNQHPTATPIRQQSASATLQAKLEFLERVGSRYGYTNSDKGFIDDWREVEFPSLISPLQNTSKNTIDNDHNVQRQTIISETVEREVYLDYAGSALPTQTQLQCLSKQTQILANPHSIGGGLASDRTYTSMQKVKDKVRVHFGINDELYFDKIQEAEESDVQNDEKYQFVFTSGATASLKLVAERFPWSSLTFTTKQHSQILMRRMEMQHNLESIHFQSMLVYPKNVHTSVIGMRSIPLERGSTFHCVSTDELLQATPQWFRSLVDATISYKTTATKIHDSLGAYEEKKDEHIECNNISNQPSFQTGEQKMVVTCWVHHLLVLPLQCNFSGDRFDWGQTVAAARASDYCTYLQCPTGQLRVCNKWNILLDIAKAAATSPVDIPNACAPDYAVASFYKMFGYPTGLGILIMKKQPKTKVTAVSEEEPTKPSEELLADRKQFPRHYFGGGSVDVVLPHKDFVVAKGAQHVNDENDEYVNLGVTVHGTEHFRGIIELGHGFQELEDLGGMKNICSHATCLAEELVLRLEQLLHDNGTPVALIYGQWGKVSNKTYIRNGIISPGSTVAFNIQDRDGSIIGYDEVSRLASLNNPPIQLRTGCFCNPGACQEALSLAESDVLEQYQSGHVCGDRRGVINGKPTGAIRASFGKDSLWEDMNALVVFIQKMFVSQGEMSLSSRMYLSSHTSSTPLNKNTAVIESLFVFPIKSCAAMRVRRWPIHQSGRLWFDREFALVDTSGAAMRLHSYPRMSEIRPQIDLKTNTLVLSAPHCDDLVLSLSTSNSDEEFTLEDVQVCGILCKGTIWGGHEASSWFSSILGVRCWLAKYSHTRKTKSASSVRRGERDDRLAYSNEASLLLVSQNSISALNAVISSQGWGKQVVSRHFRPNIVVSSSSDTQKGTEQQRTSNPEDFWHTISIKSENNSLDLIAVGKCARCQMVDIDPESGMKGNTLRALAEYRRERGKIIFGTFFSGTSNNETKEVIWIEEGDEVRAN
jgi:molybdenum cofactor sulfurtransferase